MLTALLFAVLAILNPATDIPYRLQMLGPSATLTNTETMIDAMPTESPVTAQESPQDVYPYHVYLPMSNATKTPQRVTVAEVTDITSRGYSYLEWMTTIAVDQGKRVTHEYPANPVWLMANDSSAYMVGSPWVKVTWSKILPHAEFSTIEFDMDLNGLPNLTIWADRKYTYGKPTQYQYTIASYTPSRRYQWPTLFMGKYQIFDNITPEMVGNTVTVITDVPQPALRYTLRHASRLSHNLFDAIDGRALADGLNNTLDTYGFTVDLYDPLFGLGDKNMDVRAYASATMYRDCTADLPQGATYQEGRWFAYYPYQSKVCTLGVGNYVTLTRFDFLVPMLQAIHVLNKTGNPDAVYNPGPTFGAQNTTPRQVARRMESDAWNGYGIRIWGKDAKIASSVRTDVFLVLESLLGYKHGDATSKTFADEAARWVVKSAVAADGQLWTGDNGSVLRPEQAGGQMIAWEQYQDETALRYQLPKRTILTDIIDLANMPNEIEGVLATNSESTGLMVQALRVYGFYALGRYSGGMMP